MNAIDMPSGWGDRLFTMFMRTLVYALYAFLLAPLICVVIVSFNAEAVQTFPPQHWSFHWYTVAMQTQSFTHGLVVSALLALVATLIAGPAGVAAALALNRSNWKGKAWVEAIFLAPLVVPGLVAGIAILVATAALNIRDAPVRLLIGHIVIVLPYVIRTTLASLARLDPTLGEAALTLGAGRFTAFRLIILPLIRQGMLAGMLFGFILSFDDVSVSLFLSDARTVTLPLAIMSYLQYSFDPSVAAISTLLIGVTLIFIIVLERRMGVKKLFTG